jgi:dephospho-CoA kinase
VEPLNPALRIGLTGGIGSGKSTAAAACAAAGAILIDTDAIARSLTAAGGPAVSALRTAFGDGIFGADGGLDRAAMRNLAFGDLAARRQLEGLLHPLIGAQALLEARQAEASNASVIVFDVPLLAESASWRARVHRVLVVDCEVQTQIERVAQRPGWTREAAHGVVAAQASRERRRATADAVIYNDQGMTLDGLREAVMTLLTLWNRTPRSPVEQ